MNLHGNAVLSLNQPRRLAKRVVEEDWSLTARKWVGRYREEGEAGLLDRPSAAHRVHNRTSEERIEAICTLRRLRFTGETPAARLAEQTTRSGLTSRDRA
jgi:transposase